MFLLYLTDSCVLASGRLRIVVVSPIVIVIVGNVVSDRVAMFVRTLGPTTMATSIVVAGRVGRWAAGRLCGQPNAFRFVGRMHVGLDCVDARLEGGFAASNGCLWSSEFVRLVLHNVVFLLLDRQVSLLPIS